MECWGLQLWAGYRSVLQGMHGVARRLAWSWDGGDCGGAALPAVRCGSATLPTCSGGSFLSIAGRV